MGGNFNLASGGVGHLNRKYEFESKCQVLSPLWGGGGVGVAQRVGF